MPLWRRRHRAVRWSSFVASNASGGESTVTIQPGLKKKARHFFASKARTLLMSFHHVQRMSQLTYYAKYFANELTKQCASENVEKLDTVLADAQVDVNPHEIEAALFAFRSPFSKGASDPDSAIGTAGARVSRAVCKLGF